MHFSTGCLLNDCLLKKVCYNSDISLFRYQLKGEMFILATEIRALKISDVYFILKTKYIQIIHVDQIQPF